MHLRNVEIFCEVVSRRSFSKAAEAHHVSQSSASQAVLQLEKRLGTQLIDRSKRPFELTPAGEIYYSGCRELVDGFRRIEDQVRLVENRVVGRVCVAAIYSVGLLQMDTYVRRFNASYPDVEIQLEYLHPDEVYERLLHDAADLGLVSFPREGGEFGCIPWQSQEIVLACPLEHKFAQAESIELGDLAGEKAVAFTAELTIRRRVDRWLREAGVSLTVVHEFDNVETIKRAVEVGAGIALLPEPTVLRERDGRSLHVARLVIPSEHLREHAWQRPLGIVHKRFKHFSAAAQRFVDLLREDATVAAT